ncbi:MAG TPA: glycosyl hydrolase [Methylomirabilota bacterium]|nr:glycosyl hydrolase [Methylomirabilota bacterium]
MKKQNIFKIFSITIMCCVLALVWGLIFFRSFYPKNTPPSVKGAFTTATDNALPSSHSLTPVISNQWYTSLIENFPSYPLYAMPLAFRTSSKGIGFSYPHINSTKNTIFAPYNEDFTVGYVTPFTKTPHLTSVGDWTINADLTTDDKKTLSFSLGHGLPFSVIKTTDDIVLSYTNAFQVSIDQKQIRSSSFATDAFMITTNGNNYIYVFPKVLTIHQDKNKITIPNPERIFVGLLDKKANYSLFKENSTVEILDSQASAQITADQLTVLYKLTTATGTPLITLYPHQYNLSLSKKDILGTYETIRGQLKLIKTDNFPLSFPLTIPSGSFAKLDNDYPDLTKQIQTDIQDIIKDKPPASEDYYLGTWFGKVSNLLLLADAYNLDRDKQQLLNYVEPIFLESLKHFSYDKEKTSLIADKPEFGNEDLNDHHFHYGYYIRTGAVLASFDLTLLPKIQDKVGQMVDDIATTERSSSEYPYLRNFDIYEGHSWADGIGDTADGNNQESSSEAINAWYGTYLWGKLTNDGDLQKNALYLYNMEMQSAEYYWFDKNNMYDAPYTHAIASIIWGGKVDFATWFSKDTNMIYGIQLLPITPASLYLGTLPTFSHYATDYHANGGNETKDWGDLFTIWESFYNPTTALQLKEKINKPEGNTPKSLMLYMLYLNKENSVTITPSVSTAGSSQ